MYIQINKNYLILFLIFFSILIFNLSYKYSTYKDFKENNFLELRSKIINIYIKNDYDILKIKTDNYTFFTKVKKFQNLKKNSQIAIIILTKDISFYSYLKGFYTNNISIRLREYKINKSIKYINSQHKNEDIKEIFQALFLAIPLNKELRNKFAALGISHIIAISGFHLSILAFVFYWLIHFPYSYIHQKKFPYRNKKYDVLLVVVVILFIYLLITDVVPSLLRAFVMFILGIYFLRSSIKILSFKTLLFTFMIIISLFPEYIFSLSLWFSMFGVFYIFLYLQYFKNLNKYVQIICFNYWIFLSMNPITHYFFPTTSLEQLYSPIITFLFIIFYPLELFLHLINQASALDFTLEYFLNYKIQTYNITSPLWLFISYVMLSLASIFSPKAFVLLNVVLLSYGVYLFI